MNIDLQKIETAKFTGRNRRLLHEWRRVDELSSRSRDIEYRVREVNEVALPIEYEVIFHIRSFSSVERVEDLATEGIINRPLFADQFIMKIIVPEGYPSIDAMPEFKFLTKDAAEKQIAHPWHPNIRYFGEFAGKVCLNNFDSYTEIAWCIDRVRKYLYYERYHALQEPPYPEDIKVALWVREQAEQHGWIDMIKRDEEA